MASVLEVIFAGLIGYDIGHNGWDNWRHFTKIYLIMGLIGTLLLLVILAILK